jgi:hypothetical protein
MAATIATDSSIIITMMVTTSTTPDVWTTVKSNHDHEAQVKMLPPTASEP